MSGHEIDFASEKAFTRWLLAEARERGWRAWHLETMMPVRRGDGWYAAPNRDATGFPDCVLVHPERGVVFVELKMPLRKPDGEQIAALRDLRAAGQRAYVFRPADVDAIIELLDTGAIPQLSIDDLTASGRKLTKAYGEGRQS